MPDAGRVIASTGWSKTASPCGMINESDYIVLKPARLGFWSNLTVNQSLEQR